MDKIQKALQKLSAKEREAIKDILVKLKGNQLSGLNVQRLQGHNGIFRIRKGNIRIIYLQEGTRNKILDLGRRSEKTYRDY